jgi:hypothetical protein
MTKLFCDVRLLRRIALRCKDVLSSTGFSLCSVEEPRLKPHRLKPVLLDPPDLRCPWSSLTRLKTPTEFICEMRTKCLLDGGKCAQRAVTSGAVPAPSLASVHYRGRVNIPMPTRNCSVLTPGLSALIPALEMCM